MKVRMVLFDAFSSIHIYSRCRCMAGCRAPQRNHWQGMASAYVLTIHTRRRSSVIEGAASSSAKLT